MVTWLLYTRRRKESGEGLDADSDGKGREEGTNKRTRRAQLENDLIMGSKQRPASRCENHV